MAFETVVQTRILTDTTLLALCSRIYPQQPKRDIAFPFAWYSFHRTDNLVFGAVATNISNFTFEFTALATSESAVIAITDRVRALLNAYTSLPDVGMLVLDDAAQTTRTADNIIYFVKSLKFTGMGR